jgi:hypothetical protein
LLLSSSLGVVLTYSMILCTTYNSPLATSMTGCIKDVAANILSVIAFSDYKATAMSVFGLLISFAGSAVYAIVSAQASGQAAKSESSPVLPTSASGTFPRTDKW